jgi:hydroxyacylglutathione hydrolase
MSLLIDASSLWLFETNTYVVADGPGSEAVIIDAPPDPAGISDLLATHDLTPVAALITHGHIDHAGGVDGVVSPTVAAYLHPADLDMARHPGEQLRALMGTAAGDIGSAVVTSPFTELVPGSTLTFGPIELDVLFTPGHTPGHCCFYARGEGVLFSGDQLFAGSIGRTDLPGGSYTTLMESMATQILPLRGDTAVLPGHGPATTIGAERQHNPFLQELV